MRFNVGDILQVQGGEDSWRWVIRDIENEQYLMSYHTGNNIWIPWNIPWPEASCDLLELERPRLPAQPVQRQQVDQTIYSLVYVNANAVKNVYSALTEPEVIRRKEYLEALGMRILAMKKFKTRI